MVARFGAILHIRRQLPLEVRMTFRTVMAGAAALALVACTKPPLDDQQKTALADSIEQFVAGPFLAAFEHPTVDATMALYAPGDDVVVVENGVVYAGREAVERNVRMWWGKPNLTAHFTVGSQHVAVLSRDAAVYTAMVTGAVKDSAGTETPMRFAWTGVLVRSGADWKVQSEHSSMPPAPAPAQPERPRR
jgi:ketosteroid isomerase-like protein